MTLAPEEKIFTVSELLWRIQASLEAAFPSVWIQGEISNFKSPGSGHFYFTLKDDSANLRVAMFRGANQYLRFTPADGLKVLVRGRVTAYPARGEMQLVAEAMEPQGRGALQIAFEQLREKLRLEGLFDAERKKALPFFPRHIAVVTSRSGAVIRDIIRVLRRRSPWVGLTLFPVRVQGAGSATEIATALRDVNQRGHFDLIILARGGGSLEDLWSFNEESVARAIAGSAIPVVSAVGHEVDFTIADFVADLRAPTPSAAAEMAAPDQKELKSALRQHLGRLHQALLSGVSGAKERLKSLQNARVLKNPGVLAEALNLRLDQAGERLERSFQDTLKDRRSALAALARAFQAVSPLAILERGYSIAWKQPSHELLTSHDQVAPGDFILTRLARGEIVSRVEKKTPTDGGK